MPGAARALSVVMRVLGGLLALVVLAYLGSNGAATYQAHERRDQIADLVTRELERALPVAADRQQDLVADAGREPDARWIEQHCDFSSDDAGWIVQNYRETCSVRGVTAWRVTSPEEARGLLAVEGDESTTYDGCQPLGTVDGAEVTHVDPAAADGDPWCTTTLGTAGDSRELVGDRVALEPDQWVLVDVAPLVDEPIGCVRWSVLFCSNPFGDRHAFGEPPTP